jgi:uncharacterized protein (DUF3820 family)
MDDGRMTFGRHKGRPIELVPVEYLAWAAERMPNPPQCVLAELRRRAERAETHDGLVAQSALSSRLFKRPKKGRPSQKAYWYAKAAALGRRGRRSRRRP